MMKIILGVLALTCFMSLTNAPAAQACNGSLMDDSCDGKDENPFWNERYCDRYGHTYDMGKSCGQYGYPSHDRQPPRYQPPQYQPYQPPQYQPPQYTPRPTGNVICEANDRAARRFRIQGTTRQIKKMQNEAMQYCYDNSSSPRSCTFKGCYNN